MNNRELLELAARAAGLLDEPHDWNHEILRLNRPAGSVFWNPRKDDGDVARLETAVGIGIEWNEAMVTASKQTNNRKMIANVELFEDHGGDKNAARRCASTRCAAEIGRGM